MAAPATTSIPEVSIVRTLAVIRSRCVGNNTYFIKKTIKSGNADIRSIMVESTM